MDRTVLQEGDRVRLRRTILWAPTGTEGTVVRTYGASATIYDVRLDGHMQEWTVQAADLERIESQEREV